MEFKESVSVIMPVYNAEAYVEEAVMSILNQTFSDIELLIIDDKGQDNSMEVIKSIKDPRIKIFTNDVNRGIAYATNVGLENAQGKYIALMDDDDVAMPDRLETEFTYLEAHPDIDVVGGADMTIDENGKVISFYQEVICNPKRIKAELLFRDRIHNATSMFRRDFVERHHLRYKDGFLGMQDFKFWTECAAYGKLANIDKVFSHWRQHKSNTTMQAKEHYEEQRRIKFAEILRESLRMQGFVLTEQELCKFCNVFQEYHSKPVSFDELLEVQDILKKIIRQAAEILQVLS